MAANLTARQLLAGLLKGAPQPRPLWMPIVFSLGSKTENLSLDAFLSNATKISNAMKQITGRLRSDGLSCYFDPYLEAEALGVELKWNPETQRPALAWPRTEEGELPEDLREPEEAMKRGRVAIAIEVIRRLKSLQREDALLTAGVTGPFTLAALITQSERESALALPEAALEVAASMMVRLSAAFAEAGANVIFIREEVLPPFEAGSREAWAERLAPAFNIIRFYQSLPMLQIVDSSFVGINQAIRQQNLDCVVCHTVEFPPSTPDSLSGDVMWGLALPPEIFLPEKVDDRDLVIFLDGVKSGLRPSIVTTAGDVPVDTDMKRVMRISERIRGYEWGA